MTAAPLRVFGLSPSERLRRQGADVEGMAFMAAPSAVLGDSAVAWLKANPRVLLTSPTGARLAIVVPEHERAAAEAALAGGPAAFETLACGAGPDLFNRKLRRREKLFGLSLDETPPLALERALFDSVYKGVTDLITKWAWPTPAFWVTRMLAARGTPPNAVTLVGMVLVFVASWLFWRGDLWPGLLAAWLMTFLDTVDGKLARVTATSSVVGDILDHGTDLLHPPLWWICLAVGLDRLGAAPTGHLALACGAILVCYVLGRIVEGLFKLGMGFNQYIWRPFDSAFRLIVARRNPILLIVTLGLAIGAAGPAFVASAVWAVICVVIQAVRLAQAWLARPVRPWLDAVEPAEEAAGASGGAEALA